MKATSSFLTIMLLLLGLGLQSVAKAEITWTHTGSYLAQYMQIYGITFSDTMLRQSLVDTEPKKVICGPVEVSLEEIVYDGQWLYTAASAMSLDSSTYLLPGDAQPSDPAKGFYKEDTREEERSFLQVAKEDGKQLLAAYIYIKEFDEIGAYFLDHLQVSESTSMLYSGAKLGYGNKPAHVTWSIQTYEVDLETEEYTLKDEMLVPVVVPPLQPYLEGLYVASTDHLLTEVMLIQTPLNMYIIPQWKNSNAKYKFSITVQSAEDQSALKCSPFDSEAYFIDFFPNAITITLTDHTSGQIKKIVFYPE